MRLDGRYGLHRTRQAKFTILLEVIFGLYPKLLIRYVVRHKLKDVFQIEEQRAAGNLSSGQLAHEDVKPLCVSSFPLKFNARALERKLLSTHEGGPVPRIATPPPFPKILNAPSPSP